MFLFIALGIGIIIATCYVLFNCNNDSNVLDYEYEEMKFRERMNSLHQENEQENKKRKVVASGLSFKEELEKENNKIK